MDTKHRFRSAVWILPACLFVAVLAHSQAPPANPSKIVHKNPEPKQAPEDRRGTDAVPLVIDGQVKTVVRGEITTKKTAEEAAEDAKFRNERNSSEKFNSGLSIANIVISVILTVGTGALALFTWKLWAATGKLAGDAAESSRRQLRAYVGVEEISFDFHNMHIPNFKVPDPLPLGYVFGDLMLITVRNFGATPAYELRVSVNWQPIVPFGNLVPALHLFQDYAGPVPVSASQVLDQGRRFIATFRVPELVGFQGAVAKSSHMYIYGYVAYTDVYGRRWHRHYAYVWEPWRPMNQQFLPHTGGNDETYEGERPPKMPA